MTAPQTPYIERWLDLIRPENTQLKLTDATIIAGDHHPVVMTGVVTVDMSDLGRFKYRFEGVPADLAYALREFNRVDRARYDARDLFRIIGKDTKGRDWNLGYTKPAGYDQNDQTGAFLVFGECDGMIGGDTEGAPKYSGAEVMFLVPPELWLGSLMTTRRHTADGVLEMGHSLSVGDTDINFRFQAETDRLFVSANGTQALNHPWLAEALGEPLRILFGQLLYPRLVVKFYTAGYSQVHVRRTHRFVADARLVGLWNYAAPSPDNRAFWQLYARLFAIASRERSGGIGLQAHTITRLYEEVIQATLGTPWVWALTLASACEGMTRRLEHVVPPLDDKFAAEIASLQAYVKEPQVSDHLKGVAIGALARMSEVTARKVLRQLARQGRVEDGDVKAWDEMRNQVMHGNLVLPWSNEEEDSKILALASLFRSLTRESAAAFEARAA